MEVDVVVLDVADVSGLVLRDTFSTVVPDSALSELVDADLDLGLTPSAETKVSTETLLSNMIYLSTLKQFIAIFHHDQCYSLSFQFSNVFLIAFNFEQH